MFATLTGIAESGLALVLLLGVARRVGYTAGTIYALLVWAVGEGFGGPYLSGSTDIGTGIIYTMLFLSLLAFASPARRERFSLDRALERRLGWWRFVAEPSRGRPRLRRGPSGTGRRRGDVSFALPSAPRVAPDDAAVVNA
ncbi:MAG: hypothetical protein JOZ07_01120 [Solirubrobacterales bacterium]|nr:hypothetical protein [Solirubrobacterales bacterium]